MKKTKHYVNNPDLYAAMTTYIARCKQNEQEGKPRPRVPDYIGRCIIKISEGLANKPQFKSYTYRDEMISDGIETCIRYLHNFDPTKYNNPFAYFTQIVYYSFLQRIEREKKQTYIKHRMAHQIVLEDALNGGTELTNTSDPEFGWFMDNDKVAHHEQRLEKKRQ